jgi:hypothetical protein
MLDWFARYKLEPSKGRCAQRPGVTPGESAPPIVRHLRDGTARSWDSCGWILAATTTAIAVTTTGAVRLLAVLGLTEKFSESFFLFYRVSGTGMFSTAAKEFCIAIRIINCRVAWTCKRSWNK